MSTASEVHGGEAPADIFVAIAPTPVSYRIAKRALDLGASAVTLLVMSPVMLMVAAAVRIESRGPILFHQERIGLGGRRFTLFKFRSMDVSADEEEHRAYVSRLLRPEDADPGAGTWQPIAADSRVTRVGSFLRRSHLDELPQLLNILRGDMSLVGPRPPIPYEVELYEPWHLRRLAVLPGLTGLWQAKGWGKLTFDQGVRLDIEYVERRSFRLDLWILLRTAWQIVSGRQF
jgi:lipopolysaccharide/colanic/teichoic acid biosynthesis glycosyltransferase